VKKTVEDTVSKTLKKLRGATCQPLLPTPKIFFTSLLPTLYPSTSVRLLIRVHTSKRFIWFANGDETLTSSNIGKINFDLFKVNDNDDDTLIVDSRKVIFKPE